jgi:hypothetical protein
MKRKEKEEGNLKKNKREIAPTPKKQKERRKNEE